MTFVSDRPERTIPGAVLVLEAESGARTLIVTAARPHQGRWLLHFDGIDDRTAAEALLGVILSAEALPGDDDVLWVHELVGAQVHDVAGTDLGSVVAVQARFDAHEATQRR